MSRDKTETIEILRALLTGAGIETKLLDDSILSSAGGLGLPSVMAQLWIVRDEDEWPARRVLMQYLSDRALEAKARPPWRCPACGQMIGGQFTACWNCELADTEDDPRQDPKATCDECGYHLWGLPQRRCPECGTEF